jgi:hypothetical protein
MSGGILQLPTYAFMAWTGTNLHLRLAKFVSKVVDSYRITLFISTCVNEYLTVPCGLFALCGRELQFVTKPVVLQLIALLVVNVTKYPFRCEE